MARDLPDWGALTAQETVHEVTDIGELAVRLESIVSHDRRGDVLWLCTFTDGVAHWVATLEGTDAAVALSEDYSRNGSNSAKLTGGKDGLKSADIQHYQAIPVLSNFGWEYSAMLPGTIDNLEMLAGVRDGAKLTTYGVRYVDADDQLQYLNAAASWVNFGDAFRLLAQDTLFHTLKLVVDSVNRKYVRFIIDDQEHDLSDIAADEAAASGSPAMDLRLRLYSRAGANDVVYVDDVILTQNEPPNA